MTDAVPEDLHRLIAVLREVRGVDLAIYRPAALERRIATRVAATALPSLAAYVDYVEADGREVDRLLDAVFINVTAFFRDADAWAYLEADVIPRLCERRAPDQPVRVWSAGCATGEEAYSLVMAFADRLGFEATRQRLRVFATDIDEPALVHARRGVFATERLAEMPTERRDRYFEPHGSDWRFRADLRSALVFGHHDLTRDAHISRIDLLVCRNTLMYFTAETQARVGPQLHAALAPDGYLFLGRVEMLSDPVGLFLPVHQPHRVFARLPSVPAAVPAVWAARRGVAGPGEGWRAAVERSPLPQMAVDPDGRVLLVNAAAAEYFAFAADPVGQPAAAFLGGLPSGALARAMAGAVAAQTHARLRDLRAPRGAAAARHFDAWVAPLRDADGLLVGASIVAVDRDPVRAPAGASTPGQRDLEAAVARERASSAELARSSADLQASHEELATTSEELQSTNEELATTNEQLHASNAELREINQQLLRRSDALAAATDRLGALLRSLPGAVIAVDTAGRVIEWNAMAEELWGLRADEVRGTALWELDVGFPLAALRPLADAAFGEAGAPAIRTIAAVNRRGRAFACRVQTCPVLDGQGNRTGALFCMEPQEQGPA